LFLTHTDIVVDPHNVPGRELHHFSEDGRLTAALVDCAT
jgi:hypothetical protein